MRPSQGWTLTFSHGKAEGLTTGMKHPGTEVHESPFPGVDDGGIVSSSVLWSRSCKQP